MNCVNCGHTIQVVGRVGKRDTCPRCDADLHTCLNCRFYDPAAHNQCRETQAEWERFKDKNNYCDYFEPATASGSGGKGVRHICGE